MDEYTPTTEEVADAYTEYMHGWSSGSYVTEQEARAEFHRWLNGIMGSTE